MALTEAESTQMARTPDPLPDPPPAAEPAAAGPRARRAILGDNPLQTALATLAVALLVLAFADNRSRMDRLEDTMNARFAEQDAKIDKLEDTMNARFAEQDAKIDKLEDTMNARFAEQDAKIDEINLKLTALIAALDKTVEVDAAIEGRLLDSDGSP